MSRVKDSGSAQPVAGRSQSQRLRGEFLSVLHNPAMERHHHKERLDQGPDWTRWWALFGGVHVLTGLVKVALDGGNGTGGVLLESL